MVYERNEFPHAPERRVERNLVQILDDDIVIVAGEILRVVSPGEKWISMPGADTVNVDPIQIRARRRIRPRAAQQINGMTAGDDAAENLPEVKLGTTGLRILVIQPVKDKYPH